MLFTLPDICFEIVFSKSLHNIVFVVRMSHFMVIRGGLELDQSIGQTCVSLMTFLLIVFNFALQVVESSLS